MSHIRRSKAPNCPVAGIRSCSPHPCSLLSRGPLTPVHLFKPGCPAVLQVARIFCDTFLRMEIEELRSSRPSAPNATEVEDISDQGEDEDEDLMDDDE